MIPFAILLSAFLFVVPPYDESNAVVIRVVDGDTVLVRLSNFYERTVRYIGIDAPESTRTLDCFGREAAEVHHWMVVGRTLRLEKDVNDTDRYGRLLRYAYLPDGRMVNEELVRRGAAVARSFPPDVKHQDRLRQAEAVARGEGAGLWGACRMPARTPAVPVSPIVPPPTVTVRVLAERLNVRLGPGTDYPVLGQLRSGDAVEVRGRSADGRWWQIVYQGAVAWVYADYVSAPLEAYALPVVAAFAPLSPSPPPSSPPPPLPPSPSPPPLQPPPSAGQGMCPQGCVDPPPGCVIKGNVNARGERIYHVPGGAYYDRTLVRPERGDRWFCAVAEAEANGFRAPRR